MIDTEKTVEVIDSIRINIDVLKNGLENYKAGSRKYNVLLRRIDEEETRLNDLNN